MNWMLASQIGLWVLMLIILVFLFATMKMISEFLVRFRLSAKQIEEQRLKVGQQAPLFRAKNQNGQVIRLADHPNEFTLLTFAKDSCSICHRVLNQIPYIIQQYDVRWIVITQEAFVDSKLNANQKIHFVESKDVFKNYFVNKVPYMVLLEKNGKTLALLDNADSLSEILKTHYGQSSKVTAY